jgi:DNA processing protein
MDEYGREVTELFARELARAGVCVVSGFALGVDQAAHHAALEAGGETVAVLGCGVDIPYPARSLGLARRIAENGAVLSEFPLGREPRAWHFPIRNRVIASLASGTLVVQAKERSGSLITAHLALDLGRDVYAVPGRIFDPLSTGTNGLLADGAQLVSTPLDILEHLAIGRQASLFPLPEPDRVGPGVGAGSKPPVPDRPKPKGFAGQVLDQVLASDGGHTVDDLATLLGQAVDQVLGALLELELGGYVERGPGPVYRA